MRLVLFRGALPSIMAGLRVAAPNAVPGAILAEIGGGGRWGLGAYLLGSLGRGEPDRLWRIGLVATLIAGLSYGFFALLSGRMVAATRLTVPRALLGVMIAEWLANGKGLGNLLNQSRGYLDHGMIWTVAAVSVLLSVPVYQFVVIVERRVLKRMGMATAE